MNYEIGSRVGDYEILEILGAGGMGRVYKVWNMISDRVEAMKVLRPDLMGDSDLADRFMREIKVQGSLGHINITALHTALRIDNQIIMMVEYVEGVTLHKMMGFGRVPIDKAIGYMSQILSALSYAHEHGVIHRDLKPANIMVANDGQVKLMDFGIAKLVADRKLTRTGSTIGSLYYMSPEQIRGAQDLDARADLYSIGVTLYEIVTGVRPFKGDSEYSIMEAHLRSQPIPPIEVCSEMPPGLSAIILRALEKEPEKRFQSADEFRSALSNMAAASALPETVASSVPPLQATVATTSALPRETMATSAAPSRETRVASASPIPETMAPPASRWKDVSRQRFLWIAAGALLTLVVIALVAMQLPNRSGATGNASAIQKPGTMDVKQPAGTGAITPSMISNPADGKIEKAIPPAVAAKKPDQIVKPPRDKQAQSLVLNSKNAVATSAKPDQPIQTQIKQPPKPPGETPKEIQKRLDMLEQKNQPPLDSSSANAPAGARQLIPQPSSKSSAAQAQLAKQQMGPLREQYESLRIRADAIKDSADGLRRQQTKMGAGMRMDMVAAGRRMELHLNRAMNALESGAPKFVKDNLALAEREIQMLEKFLNKRGLAK